MATYCVTYYLNLEIEADDEEQAEALADEQISEAIERGELGNYLSECTNVEPM